MRASISEYLRRDGSLALLQNRAANEGISLTLTGHHGSSVRRRNWLRCSRKGLCIPYKTNLLELPNSIRLNIASLEVSSLSVHPSPKSFIAAAFLRNVAVAMNLLKIYQPLQHNLPSIMLDKPPSESDFVEPFATNGDDWAVILLCGSLVMNPRRELRVFR